HNTSPHTHPLSLHDALPISVRPGPADGRSLRLPAALFTAAAVAFGAVAYTTGQFSRAVGLGLLGLFLVYLVLSVRKMRTAPAPRSEEHTSELQSRFEIVCRP